MRLKRTTFIHNRRSQEARYAYQPGSDRQIGEKCRGIPDPIITFTTLKGTPYQAWQRVNLRINIHARKKAKWEFWTPHSRLWTTWSID